MENRKQSRNHKRLLLWFGCVAAYLLVLLLLLLAERTDPNASIRTLADAFWYSVVTISTVGYGDLYPVTALGRVLGVLFVLLSVGLLTFLISTMIAALTGKLFPALQLRLLKGRPWYVFSCGSSAVTALAEDLAAKHPEGVFLFAKKEDIPVDFAGTSIVYPGTVQQLVSRWKEKCVLFLMDEDQDASYEKAVLLRSWCKEVFCMTQYAPDLHPDGVALFDRYDCCAQAYWRNHGLAPQEKTVLLIGDGNYARKLLEKGLLLNVFGPSRQIQYHVFGDWADFRRNHHSLDQTLDIDRIDSHPDALFFHDAPWNQDEALLARADRILICQDGQAENMAVLRQLRLYFPTGAKVHLRADGNIPTEQVFGTDAQIFTEELVMHDLQTRAARQMHEIYLESTGAQGPTWEQLSQFLRLSNVAAADHLLTKVRLLLEDETICALTAENCAAAYARYVHTADQIEQYRWIEHQRWMRFHSLYNWHYAPQRDNALRHHPLMRPYEQLSQQEQQKDDYAWELLKPLSQRKL